MEKLRKKFRLAVGVNFSQGVVMVPVVEAALAVDRAGVADETKKK